MEENMTSVIESLVELLEQKNYSRLKEIINEMIPADLALLFEELDKKNTVITFRLLSKELSAETFAYLEPDKQKVLIDDISDTELRLVLSQLYLDDTVDIIEEMPANVVTRILNNTNSETRAHINEILQYPEDSAGSIMTIEYVSFPKKLTVAEAISKLRREGVKKETVYTCYVTENRKLIGYVNVSTLLAASDDELIGDIMETSVVSVTTHEDKEVVARTFNKYDLIAMPVVDKEGRLVGIVTVDDAMEVLQEENTEDISRMAAMEPIEDGYFKTSVWAHAKKRVLWLMVLMISATVTGIIIQNYEAAIGAFPILVTCIPMLMDTGGNSGSQSSTMMIRGLALDEIRFSDILRVIFKEFRISLIVSVLLAIVNYGRLILMYRMGILGDTGGVSVYVIAAIVSLSLIFVVVLAKFIGCTLPLLVNRAGLDPALMAAPLITTIVDACAVIVYFKIATTWLHIVI